MSRIAVPKTAEGLNDVLTNPQLMRELLKDPEDFSAFVENHVNLRLKADPELLPQVNEQFESFMINYLRENESNLTVPRLNLSPTGKVTPPGTVYNKAALGAKYDTAFPDFASMLHSISDHKYKDSALSSLLGGLKNDLSSVKPSDGGFLIPEVLRAQLLQTALETAVVRSRAMVIPMDSLSVQFPTVDSTSNVSSVFGGIIGYWTEEGATLTESQPRFGRVKLEAHKLTLYTEIPNELLQDSIVTLTAFMNQVFPKALAWFEDVAFFVGGGVGEPLGFLSAPAMISVTRTGANTVDWEEIVAMYARMLPQSLGNAVWIVSPDVMPELLTMVIAGGTSPVWMGGGQFPSGAAMPPLSMLGCPIIVSEKARSLGTAGDINFVDLSYYLVGDRQAMSARQSEDFRFQNDITAFRVIERIDGRPWLASAITPQNGGATLSPFVRLAAA